MSFATFFVFRRPRAAPYRRGDGTLTIAAVDVPRFDHERGGGARGLLVEAGSEMGQHDQVTLRAPIAIEGPGTIFHEIEDSAGAVQRRAHYSLNTTATVAACLAQLGHHRTIGAVPGFVPIRSGAVAYKNKRWSPPTIVTLADGRAIALADGLLLLAS